MTRDELWSLPDCDIWELYYEEFKIRQEDTPLNVDDARAELEDVRNEIQYNAAEAQQER